jgi:hypothetical protein
MNVILMPKLFNRKLFKVSIIVLLAAILFAIVYGRQTYATYLIYNRDEKQKAYLDLTPESRNLNPSQVQDRTVLNAFGYQIDLPLKQSPRFIDLEGGKGLFFIHEYGIVIYKPLDFPVNMYQHLKASEKAGDVSHFKSVFKNKFKNNFEFVKSAFYSKPTLLAIFRPIEETTLLYYQLSDKLLYADTAEQIPARIYYFEAAHCKGFQIGDPSLTKTVTLWLFPDRDREIKVHIQGIEVGKIKQEDIDLIITTFKEANIDPA